MQQSASLQSLTQSGLVMRQEVFAARSELASGIASANDAAQGAAIAQVAVTVEATFAELDKLTADMTDGIRALGIRGQTVEHVIEQQVAGQSGQEGILTDASNQMDATISKVAALAKSIDGTQLSTTAHSAQRRKNRAGRWPMTVWR